MNNKSRIDKIIQASRGNPKVITEDSAKEILSQYSNFFYVDYDDVL